MTCVVVRPALAGADPESLRARLERDRELASAACARHGGSVAEVRGEELLLAFGTPLAHEDDALRALRASLELRGDALALGVGTGDVVAPLIGEAPAAAERQARAAAAGEIRIDEPTWRLVRHGARTSKLPGGAFLLTDLDADAPAILRRLDRPLVGRERELARLRSTFARVVGERAPALLTIRGEPGIGKSRLAAELPALVGPEGRVLTAAARPTARASPTGRCARWSTRREASARWTPSRPRSASSRRWATRWRRRSASRPGGRVTTPAGRSRG